MPLFSEWQNFYVVVGSAAGALIGLQFVVMALIANTPRAADLAEAGAAFSTPTIVQFASVLGMAAVLCMAWHEPFPPFVLLFVSGLIGFVYSVRNVFVLRRQSAYTPVLEDWTFYAVLPVSAYVLMVGASAMGLWQPRNALFGVAACTMLLLVIGIHNAWDSVSYHVFAQGSTKR